MCDPFRAYFKTIWASSKQQHDDAWQYQNMCVSAFIKGTFHIHLTTSILDG